MEYIKQANTGVRGIIQFENKQPAAFVTVKIDSREPFFKTNENGEYYRILLPGTYQLYLLYNCQQVYATNFTISSQTKLLELNITLSNNLFNTYNNYNLNKYSVFCTSNKQPASCSNNYVTKNSKTSIPSTTSTTSKKLTTTTLKKLTTTTSKVKKPIVG